MAGLSDLFQKAVYLGVGLASYTGEIASERLGELRGQAQKLVDELVQRGEITAEEGRKLVDEMLQRSQASEAGDRPDSPASAPRTIEIDGNEVEVTQPHGSAVSSGSEIVSDDNAPQRQQAEALRREVERLQAELERLKTGH